MKGKRILLSLVLSIALVMSLCMFAGCKSISAEYFNGTWKVALIEYNKNIEQYKNKTPQVCDYDFITVKNNKFSFISTPNESFESSMKYLGTGGTTSDDGVNFDWGFGFDLTDRKLHCGAHVVSDSALRLEVWELKDDGSYESYRLWRWYLVRCEDTTAKFASFDKTKLNGVWNRYVASRYSVLGLDYSAEKWDVSAESIQVEKTMKNGTSEKTKTNYSWETYGGLNFMHTETGNGYYYGFIFVNADNQYHKIYAIKAYVDPSLGELGVISSSTISSEYNKFAVLTKAD